MKENNRGKGGPETLYFVKQSDYYSRPDTGADLSLNNTGEQQCPPRHAWAGVRATHLIHYVLSGRGSFTWRGVTHRLGAGEAFLISPGERHHYQADAVDPWHYVWVDFVGKRTQEFLGWAGLSDENPIYSRPFNPSIPPFFRELHGVLGARKPQASLVADAVLHRLLAALVDASPHPPAPVAGRAASYVHRALAFIHDNYGREISIAGLADLVGIHRAHLAEVFHQTTGQTVRDYLLTHRISQACHLLETTDLSILEISNSVGYPGYTAFSIRFRSLTGETPGSYRARRRSERPGQPWLGRKVRPAKVERGMGKS